MQNETSKKDNNVLSGILLMTAGVFAVSVKDAVSKFLMETDYHPVQVLGLGAWIIVAVLLASSVIKRRHFGEGIGAFQTEQWRWHLARAGLSMITGILFLYSLKFFKLVDVTIIFFISPILMTALSAIFLKEEVGIIRWSAVFIGFIGVLIALQPDIDEFDWKMLLPLAAATSYSMRSVLIRGKSGNDNAAQIVFHTRLWVALLATTPMVIYWTPMAMVDVGLLVIIAVLMLMGHVLITESILKAPLSVVGPYEFTALLWTAILGYWIWGDLPSSTMSLGASFIVGAGLLIAWREGRYKTSRQ